MKLFIHAKNKINTCKGSGAFQELKTEHAGCLLHIMINQIYNWKEVCTYAIAFTLTPFGANSETQRNKCFMVCFEIQVKAELLIDIEGMNRRKGYVVR